MKNSKFTIQNPKFPRYAEYKDSGVEWLGDVPEHWEVVPNRALLSEQREKVGKNASDYLLLSLTLKGVIPRNMENPQGKFPAEFNTYTIVKPDDLVFCLFDIDETPRAIGHAEHDGMITGAYNVYSPTHRINSRYIYYYYLFLDADKSLKPLYSGLRKTIQRSVFGSAKAPLPPKPEQDRIVAFLDRKTAEIDTLIAKKKRQIELLDEQKAILINRAVTRGIVNSEFGMRNESLSSSSHSTFTTHNSKFAPSGIEWIGDIPQNWEVLQLRRLQRYGTSITYGIVQAGPDVENGIPYIRTSDMKGTEFDHSGFLKTSHKIDAAYRRSKVEEGDLVIAIRATLGKALRVPKHLHGANLTQGTAKVAPGPRLNSKFLAYAFNSSYCQEAVMFVGKGTTFLEITLEALRRIQLVVPLLAEQLQIVSTIDKAVGLHRESVRLTSKEIESLKSLRSTLIAHAVTGRIKV